MMEVREYTTTASYTEGEVIWHPVWQDKGVVKKIEFAKDKKTQIMWVEFERLGTKKLVMSEKKN